MTDLRLIERTMHELEESIRTRPEPVAPVGEVIASMVGLDFTPEFDKLLRAETERAVKLMRGHYAGVGVQPTVSNFIAIGFLQGVTFARAVRTVESMTA